MRLVATRKAHQNRAAADPWTVVHFGTGLAAGLTAMPLTRALGVAVVYEAVEQLAERSDAGRAFFRTSGPEIWANVVLDVAVFALGHRLGCWWNEGRL